MSFKNWPAGLRYGIYGIIFDVALYVFTIIIKLIGSQFSGSFDPDFMWNLVFFFNVPIPFPILAAIFGSLFMNLKNRGWAQLLYKNKIGISTLLIGVTSVILGLVFQIEPLLTIFFLVIWFTGLGGLSDGGSRWISIIPVIILAAVIFYILGYVIGKILDKIKQKM